MSPGDGAHAWRGFASLSNVLTSLLLLCLIASPTVADVPHVPACAQNAISIFMVNNHCESDYRCLCSPGLRPELDAGIGQTCPSVDHQVALQGIQMDCSTWLTSTTSSTTTSTSAPASAPTTTQSNTAATTTSSPSRTKDAASAPTDAGSVQQMHDSIPDTVKVGVGVGLGVTLPLLGVIAYLIYRIRDQRMAHAIELAKLKGWEPGVAMG